MGWTKSKSLMQRYMQGILIDGDNEEDDLELTYEGLNPRTKRVDSKGIVDRHRYFLMNSDVAMIMCYCCCCCA